MNKKTETLICAFLLMTVGVYGFLLDLFNGMDNILPIIFNLNFFGPEFEPIEGVNAPIGGYRYTMNSAWSLFIIMGLMFFIIELFQFKSKYPITAIPKMLKYKILLTINEGKILHNEYLIRRINEKNNS